MSLKSIFETSSQGMTAQRERLEAASANLANANTTRTAEGGPYRRRDVVFEATSIVNNNLSFVSEMGSMDDNQPASQGVRVTTIINDASTGIRRYEPGHPDADSDGYITMPDVNPLEETINILSAARAFEANATAFNTAKEMARASLRLGEA
jgi:flagellar basal-body rod protein FlgC